MGIELRLASKHMNCGSELAREEAGTLAHIFEGRNVAFASKVERHPGRSHGIRGVRNSL